MPPRALKDYYRMISDPLSLKKLQKMVKGVHGRGDVSGVSQFKSWAAFEEKAKLLWENAYFYNEEGSDIFELAQDLEVRSGPHLSDDMAANMLAETLQKGTQAGQGRRRRACPAKDQDQSRPSSRDAEFI